jgi:hypothetical protein
MSLVESRHCSRHRLAQVRQLEFLGITQSQQQHPLTLAAGHLIQRLAVADLALDVAKFQRLAQGAGAGLVQLLARRAQAPPGVHAHHQAGALDGRRCGDLDFVLHGISRVYAGLSV